MVDDVYPAPACLAFGTEAAERLTDMFVGMGQKTRIENWQVPAERAVFRKLHGARMRVSSRFRICPNASLPACSPGRPALNRASYLGG